jgi:hypothetical protein
MQRRKHEKGFQIETTETTRTGKIIETMGIKTESVDLTTPWLWLTNPRNSQNSRSLKTLRMCIVYGTLKKITQLCIAASSLTDIQERVTMETRKRIARRKMRTTQGIRDFSNQREQ